MCVCVCVYIVILVNNIGEGLGATGPDAAVVMSSANRLVGTGFASRYRLQPIAGF